MSEWRDRANRRRDERHTKVDDGARRVRSTKDTRRWCGGREGREHVLTVEPWPPRVRKPLGKCQVCTACGKRFRWWHPFGDDTTPPAWATEEK
jgi:hypothetical protein